MADRTRTNKLPSELSFTVKERYDWMMCDSSSPLREEKDLASLLNTNQGGFVQPLKVPYLEN